jgi:hypothetical protein
MGFSEDVSPSMNGVFAEGLRSKHEWTIVQGKRTSPTRGTSPQFHE